MAEAEVKQIETDDKVITGDEEIETDEFGNDVSAEYKREEEDDETGDQKESSDGEDGKEENLDGEEGEAGEDGSTGDDDENKDGEEELSADEKNANEISSLRQMLRSQKTAMKLLQDKLDDQQKALVDKDILEEDELSEEDAAAIKQRNDTLESMVELMELNPKFEDVNDVCAQENFDDVVEMLAGAYVAENGGDADAVADNIAATVWGKANPYKEIYQLVKQYHPNYASAGEDAPADKVDGKKGGKKEVKVAPSLSGLPGGGGDGKSGWTSARIDKMSEKELANVPADVYEKYMRDELD